MKSQTIWRRLPALIFTLCLGIAFGCARGSHSTGSAEFSTSPGLNSADGGADGSGGQTGISSPEQVKKAIEFSKSVFLHSLIRVRTMLTDTKGTIQDSRFSLERVKLIRGLLDGTDLEKTSAIELLEKNLVEWNLDQDSACDASNDDHADGSAASPRKICISVHRLARFPYRELKANLVHLLSHEFAHLYFGEDDKIPYEIEAFFAEIDPDFNFPDTLKVAALLRQLIAYEQAMNTFLSGIEKNDPNACSGNYFERQNQFIADVNTAEDVNRLYFPPKFTESMRPLLDFASARVAVVQTIGQIGVGCDQSQESFYRQSELKLLMPRLETAKAQWYQFYKDVLDQAWDTTDPAPQNPLAQPEQVVAGIEDAKQTLRALFMKMREIGDSQDDGWQHDRLIENLRVANREFDKVVADPQFNLWTQYGWKEYFANTLLRLVKNGLRTDLKYSMLDYLDGKGLRWELREDAPCAPRLSNYTGDSNHHDAEVILGEEPSICVSVQRLSRYRPDEMRPAFVSLLAHHLVHFQLIQLEGTEGSEAVDCVAAKKFAYFFSHAFGLLSTSEKNQD